MRGNSILPPSGDARAWFFISLGVTATIVCSIVLLGRNGIPYAIFQRLFLHEDLLGALVLIGVILAGLTPPMQTAGMQLGTALGNHPAVAAMATAAVLSVGAFIGYLTHPLSMDEYAAVFQSRVFAAGELCGRFPPALIDWLIPRQFQNVFFVASHDTGCVVSAYWPGFALLMTPFSMAGAPWLCNPAIGGATVFVMHRLGMRIFADRTLAGLVVLLTIASTAVTINGISMYSMPAHLLFNAVYCLLLLRQEARFAVFAGLIGGWALILHNPFPHALFAAPWLVWLATSTDRRKLLLSIAIGYAPFIAGALLWTDFIQDLKGVASAAGSSGAGVAVSPLAALLGSAARIFRFPLPDVFQARAIGLAKLWLWAAPGLLVLAVWGFSLRRQDPRIRLLAASGLLTLVGYLFYPEDQGHGWGFRYFHSAWLVVPLLAVAVFTSGAEKLDRTVLRKMVAGCAFTALIVMTAFRMYQTREFIGSHLAQLPPMDGGAPAIQIINATNGYYAADLVQNDPFLRTGPARMISRGRARDARMLAEHFPGITLLANGSGGATWGYIRGSMSSPSILRNLDHREEE